VEKANLQLPSINYSAFTISTNGPPGSYTFGVAINELQKWVKEIKWRIEAYNKVTGQSSSTDS